MKTLEGATLQFLGASGTVTGSRFLLETSGARVLLDCGLFQGGKKLRGRNWETPPFVPGRLDAVVLSHAHLDHSGYLPVLVREGFRGPVHCTAGTRDLLKVLLPDAAKLVALNAILSKLAWPSRRQCSRLDGEYRQSGRTRFAGAPRPQHATDIEPARP